MEFAVANRKLDEDFGLSNVHMVLTDANLAQDSMVEMTEELKGIDGVKSVLNLASFTGAQVPANFLPDQLVNNLKTDKWELSLIISEYHTATDEMSAQINSINEVLKKYDNSALLIGEAALTKALYDQGIYMNPYQ